MPGLCPNWTPLAESEGVNAALRLPLFREGGASMIPVEKAMRHAIREFLEAFSREHAVSYYEALVLAQKALRALDEKAAHKRKSHQPKAGIRLGDSE
jgi:hypothetical protein